jgi:hypothetical protein
MCARDREFTIRGLEHCLTRGYDRIGFFEVDTQDQRQWTVQLTDGPQRQETSQPPMAAPVPPASPVRPASGSPDIRQAAPARSTGPRSTPLPTAPAGAGPGSGGVPAGVPAFTAPR